MTELVLDSLQRRMSTMHSLYYQAVDSMDMRHVNHFERNGVLPIAFSLFHYTHMQDTTFMVISGELPVWNDQWQERVQMAINDNGKERSVEEMVHQRIGNFEEFKSYQRTVFERTEAWLQVLDPSRLTEVLIARPFPEVVASTYSARCAGPQGITLLDAIECWHYQHGLRHMGEIELARALAGVGQDAPLGRSGMTS
ncbi:MAG: hypothetical protein WD029_09675 [Microthrixaceae bacterium]